MLCALPRQVDDCVCNHGYTLQHGKCKCTANYKCPPYSSRKPNRHCYNNYHDCMCDKGYAMQPNGQCKQGATPMPTESPTGSPTGSPTKPEKPEGGGYGMGGPTINVVVNVNDNKKHDDKSNKLAPGVIVAVAIGGVLALGIAVLFFRRMAPKSPPAGGAPPPPADLKPVAGLSPSAPPTANAVAGVVVQNPSRLPSNNDMVAAQV